MLFVATCRTSSTKLTTSLLDWRTLLVVARRLGALYFAVESPSATILLGHMFYYVQPHLQLPGSQPQLSPQLQLEFPQCSTTLVMMTWWAMVS
jgi:hypothetical protein